jgi:hypothetical protein
MFLFCSHVNRDAEGGLSAQLVRVRCVRGYMGSPTKVQPCGHTAVLDMRTPVWAKGRNFPLGKLGTRLMCPTCGSRDVNVIFKPPMVRTVVGGRQ